MAVEYSQIRAALNKGEYDLALKLVNQLDKNSPDYNKVDYIKASVAFNKNELDKAEKYIKKALENYPNAKTYNLAGGVYGMQAQNASIFSKLGYAKKSKKYMQKAYEAEPSNENYIDGLIQFNIQAPGIAGGDSDAVEPLLKVLEKINPIRAIQLRTQFIADEEDEEKALKYLSSEMLKRPEVLELRYSRAFIYMKMDENKKAFDDLSYVVDHKPENWQSDNTWASALYQRGKLSSVKKINLEIGRDGFLEYLKMDKINNTPDKSWATYRLGLIYQHLNQEDLAQQSFKKALLMNPEKELKKRLSKVM